MADIALALLAEAFGQASEEETSVALPAADDETLGFPVGGATGFAGPVRDTPSGPIPALSGIV
ncbi:hypothetical protein MMB17_08815 [Methylobacterium organophilum]|uniref:hypothetical protein n=1 Tax=Methylobacterium organophilum TaxID=410 RepID=UPI001F1325C1|nr:hypothetical protein [Methylobacterium organophilum]UMY19380.1 hypothetical protein MMB17_08815 [Methylobacterium organophilum]